MFFGVNQTLKSYSTTFRMFGHTAERMCINCQTVYIIYHLVGVFQGRFVALPLLLSQRIFEYGIENGCL